MPVDLEPADAEHALAQVGVDPRAALAEADAVVAGIARPRTADDVRAVATAHRAAGLALRSLGDPVSAEQRIRRGVTLADRSRLPALAAEVRMSHAFVLLEVGRVSAALSATDRALDTLRGVKAARVRTIRALVLHRAARSDDAFADYAAALPVLRRAGDRDWEARLRHNRAMLEAEFGRTDEVVADLEWVRAYDLDSGHTIDAADALFNIGVARQRSGDIPEALALFDQAEIEWVGVERPERWIARSEAYLSVGLVIEAANNARAAVAWLTGRGWGSLEGYAELNLARCLLALPDPDLAGARAAAARAHAEFADRRRPEAQTIADYVRATAAVLGGPSRTERAAVGRTVSRLESGGYPSEAADLRVTAGFTALRMDLDGDAELLLAPLASQVRARRLDVRSRAWFARALLARADGDERRAGSCLRRAWTVVEVQRSLLGATELLAASATHARDLVATGAEMAVERGSASGAFDWAERGRATALRYRPVSAPRDPQLAAALARLRFAASREEESRLDGSSDRTAATARARAEADVLRITRAVAGGRPGLSLVRAGDVGKLLDGDVLVEYLTVLDELWAVTVGPARTRLVPLGPLAPVREALESVRFAHRRLLTGFGAVQGMASLTGAMTRALDALDSRLLTPLARVIGDRDLVICPDAGLTAVPWSALPRARGRTVRIAPSAAVWCEARHVPQGLGSVVVVAGPGLAGAEAEAREVSALYPGSVRITGAEATVGRVLELASSSALLHVAAHGQLRTDNPLFSSLQLADGPMTAYDLERVTRVPTSVVLSACSSGAGHAQTADETLGLAWTLLGLGAASVVAPLLPVPDESTRALMVSLHQLIAAGATAAAALAETQRSVERESALWAAATAFVAFGA